VCSGACADGAQCSTLKVCMSSGSASSGSGKASSGGSETFGGCSCDVGGSVAEPGAWPAVLAALAGMARLRRRAGSPHGAAARRHRSA
jgi:MYXO-CTERM domain-containing protein